MRSRFATVRGANSVHFFLLSNETTFCWQFGARPKLRPLNYAIPLDLGVKLSCWQFGARPKLRLLDKVIPLD